jgi:TetR/AcrR family transcriptional repressor of nem operon
VDHEKLMRTYVGIFRKALADDNKMCLASMMAAEYADIPAKARTQIDRFRDLNTRWLAKVLAARHARTAAAILDARAVAIFAAIEGAQLVARGKKDIRLFDRIIDAYIQAGLFS